MSLNRRYLQSLLVLWIVCGFGLPLRAEEARENGSLNRPVPLANRVKIDQHLGAQIPQDLSFVDETGKKIALHSFFDGKRGPVILALVYHSCANLCSMVLGGLFRSLGTVSLERGKEFSVVAVSINPHDSPESATMAKRHYFKTYLHSQSEAGVNFLTGEPAAISRLADAVGFRYEYDPISKQYAHPGAIVIVTPEGKISKYFFGVDFPERDLRFALIEASQRKIGTAIDHFLLYCYRFDPTVGRYGIVIVRLLRLAGVITLALLAFFVIYLSRKGSWRKGLKTGEVLR